MMEEYSYMELTTLKLHALEASDWTVVVAGIGIVLCTLLVLILVFYAFGAIVSKMEATTKKRAAKKIEQKTAAQPIPAPAVSATAVTPTQPVVEQGISGEVVAAISAAVYEIEGSGAKIASITPVRSTKKNPITGRNPWANAAVIDNTRPF
jgi:Na+-transporting methylmalonyl-CoA/oxaloacetate decarboxylase gamma subunit